MRLGLDSLAIIVSTEEAFSLAILDAAARRRTTVGDLWAYVVEQTGGTTPAKMDAVWWRVAEIVVEESGVEHERVTPEARFQANLGID